MSQLTRSERAKLDMFAEGLEVSPRARRRLCEATLGRPATPADYASTSGLILAIEHDTWVNAPIIDYNPSFVCRPAHTLDWDGERFVLQSATEEPLGAEVWLPPAFHDEFTSSGEQFTAFGFMHADRVRVSPIEGCAMACKFCDLPYRFRYRTKPIEGLIETVEAAISDRIQPAGHVLVSGGTPIATDVGYLRDMYDALLSHITAVPIDIMMVPVEGLFDTAPTWLGAVNELSINLELVSDEAARSMMPHKYRFGLQRYLSFLECVAERLGGNRVRSMLMVGLESIEATLSGVRMIAERGCVPVLSPFRPDSATPLRGLLPPTADFLEEVYRRAVDITADYGVSLGPSCVPCTHNTVTFAASGSGEADCWHARPQVI